MTWLLRQLEQNPRVTFGEEELARVDLDGFARLRSLGVLHRTADRAQVSARMIGGRLLTVLRGPGNELEGFDPDQPDEPPISLDEATLDIWKPDLLRLAEILAAKHELTAAPEMLHPRLMYIAKSLSGQSVTLGLFATVPTALETLAALPNLVAPGHTGHVAILPSLRIGQAATRSLLAAGIQTASLTSDALDLDPPLPRLDPTTGGDPQPVETSQTTAQLEHTENFDWVKLDGKEYVLSINRARVVAKMHQLGGAASESEILYGLEDDIKSARIVDIFKGSPLIGPLVISLGRRYYRLKYY
jgi:hypothetical protein